MDLHLLSYYLGILALVVLAVMPKLNNFVGWKHTAVSLVPVAMVAYYFMYKENFINW